MTSDVSLNNALDYAQSTKTSSSQLAEDFDDFLILLTTQLQNQDPLSPMDSTEFTNQLVNFAGVEQQINANQKLDSLVALSLGSSFSSALGYVGKDISYLSGEANFDGNTPMKITYAVSGKAEETRINIYDEEGTLIRTDDLSSVDNKGVYTWDGKNSAGQMMPAGTYEIGIAALDAENQALKSTTVVSGRVSGVETQNGTTFLLVGERAVSIGNIINVQEPKATTPAPDTDTDDTDTDTDTDDTDTTTES